MYGYTLPFTDPALNLAAEEYLFTTCKTDCFLVWQNCRAIVVGKNQNVWSQVHPEVVKDHNISVVRRITGGGTVYHDLGNVNFTFIRTFPETPAIDFFPFVQPVMAYLEALGVPVTADGRNDLVVKGLKISGNAQHVQKNRVLHHGTLLFETDLDLLSAAILRDPIKYAGAGVRSTRRRVTNISAYLSPRLSVEAFRNGLFTWVQKQFSITPASLSQGDRAAITRLAHEKYRSWEWNWNFGASPAYNFKKSTRTPGGTLDIRLNVKNGIIRNIRIFGDYFGSSDIREIESRLAGCRHDRDAIFRKLRGIDLSTYIRGISLDALVSAMF